MITISLHTLETIDELLDSYLPKGMKGLGARKELKKVIKKVQETNFPKDSICPLHKIYKSRCDCHESPTISQIPVT